MVDWQWLDELEHLSGIDDELDVWEHLSCIVEFDLEQLHNLHNDYPYLRNALKMEM